MCHTQQHAVMSGLWHAPLVTPSHTDTLCQKRQVIGSQNHYGWKRPVVPSSPTTDPLQPCPLSMSLSAISTHLLKISYFLFTCCKMLSLCKLSFHAQSIQLYLTQNSAGLHVRKMELNIWFTCSDYSDLMWKLTNILKLISENHAMLKQLWQTFKSV